MTPAKAKAVLLDCILRGGVDGMDPAGVEFAAFVSNVVDAKAVLVRLCGVNVGVFFITHAAKPIEEKCHAVLELYGKHYPDG